MRARPASYDRPRVELDSGERQVGRRHDVDLYVRTYTTVLRTSGDVQLRAFERAHFNVVPSLHHAAAANEVDADALIYAANRLPAEISAVDRVVLGQLPEHFAQTLGAGFEAWTPVQAPARRRQWHYDGRASLAIHVASASDIDDVIPTLVAYQVEWNKLHHIIRADTHLRAALISTSVSDNQQVERVRHGLGIAHDDWRRLERALGATLWPTLERIAACEKDIRVRLLGGTHVGYAKLARRWWQPIGREPAERGLLGQPTYFVSSNLHSLGESRFRLCSASRIAPVELPRKQR